MSSKSVARSAGLRSICRSPLDPPQSPVAAVSVGSARFPPTGRPVRSGLARWFRLYQFSSFRSVRSFVARSSSPVPLVPFVPARSFLLVRSCSFVRSCSACLISFSRLVPLVLNSSRSISLGSRSGFVSFGSGSVELVLCSRLLACRFYLFILAYIIH